MIRPANAFQESYTMPITARPHIQPNPTPLALLLALLLAASPTLAADAPSPAQPAAPEAPALTVSGKVLDTDDHPVAGATVLLREWSNYRRGEDPFAPIADVLATTTTDQQGAFSFRDVPSRPFLQNWPESTPWDIVVKADGRALAWHHLADPAEPAPLKLTLLPESKVTGRLVDDQGNPIVKARVTAEEIAPLGSPMRSDVSQPDRLDLGMSQVAPTAETDAEGRFQITGLPPSMRITLVARHDDFVRKPIFIATTDQPQPELISTFVVDGKQQTVTYPIYSGNAEVSLQPGCRLNGRVTYADSGKPCALARIGVSGPSWYSATADAEGRFTLSALPPAQYSILTYPPEQANYLVRQSFVTLAPDAKPKELNVPLEPGLPITGKVLASDTGAGVEGVEVFYRADVPQDTSDRSLARASITDAQGAFRVVAPPGKAELILSGPVPDYDVPVWRFSQQEPQPRFVQAVDVAPGKPLEGIQFTVTPGLIIDGTVTDPQGKPSPDANVLVIRDDLQTVSLSTETDSDGHFRIAGLSPTEPQQLLVIQPDKKLIANAQVEAATDDAPTRTAEVKIQLQPAASAVGIVLVSGKPLAGVQVTLLMFRTEKEQRYAMTGDYAVTDQQGRYRFDLLEPGQQYGIAFHGQGYTQEESPSFTPKPGQQVDVTPLELLRTDRSVCGTRQRTVRTRSHVDQFGECHAQAPSSTPTASRSQAS